jgi:hypothetical protein
MEQERLINIERWDYALSRNGDRVKILQETPLFEEITEEIKREMEILCFHSDKCSDDKTFKRAVYCIHVGEKLFDWFFNSKNGYRAAYFRSPTDGLKANQHFIESLMPELLASDRTTPIFSKKFIEESLKSPFAKAWLAEENGFNCSFCEAEWKNPSVNDEDKIEIANNKWEHKKDPKYGRKAPELTKIRIFGAFLNKHYKFYVPKRKRNRHKEIHEKGWS